MTYSLGRAPGYMGIGRRAVPSITWSSNTFKDPLIAASSAFAALIIEQAAKVPVSKRRALIDDVLNRVKPGTAADASRRKAHLIREGKSEDQATFDAMRLAIVNAIADRLVQAGKSKSESVQGLGLYPWDPWSKWQDDGYTFGYGMQSYCSQNRGRGDPLCANGLGSLGNIFDDAWSSVVQPALCVTGAVAGTIVSPSAGAIQQGQSAIGCGSKQLKQQRDIARLQAEQAATMERMQSAQLAASSRKTTTLLIAGGVGAVVLVTAWYVLK